MPATLWVTNPNETAKAVRILGILPGDTVPLGSIFRLCFAVVCFNSETVFRWPFQPVFATPK